MFTTVSPGDNDNMFFYTAGDSRHEARQWLKDECKEITKMMSTDDCREKFGHETLLMLQGDFQVNPNMYNYSQQIEHRLGIYTTSKSLPPKLPLQHEVYFSQQSTNAIQKGTSTMTYLESATSKKNNTIAHEYTMAADNARKLLDTTNKNMFKLKQRIDDQANLLEDIARSIYEQFQAIQNIKSIQTNQSNLKLEALRELLPESSKSLIKLTLAVRKNANTNQVDVIRPLYRPGGKQEHPDQDDRSIISISALGRHAQ